MKSQRHELKISAMKSIRNCVGSLVLVFLLGTLAYGQATKQESTGLSDDAYQNLSAMEVLKMYQHNYPDDAEIATMMKYQQVLESGQSKNSMAESDVKQLQLSLDRFLEKARFVNRQIAKGTTPDLAQMQYARLVQSGALVPADQKEAGNTRTNQQPSPPSLSVPPGN